MDPIHKSTSTYIPFLMKELDTALKAEVVTILAQPAQRIIRAVTARANQLARIEAVRLKEEKHAREMEEIISTAIEANREWGLF